MASKIQMGPTEVQITIVGLGGAGYWTLFYTILYLRQISKHIRIFACDFDVLSESNLNRLPFTQDDVGKFKAVLCERLKPLFPNIYNESNMETRNSKFNHEIFLHSGDFDSMCEEYNYNNGLFSSSKYVMIDCTDNIQSQLSTSRFAKDRGWKFMKAGSTVDSYTLTKYVSEWDTEVLQPEDNQNAQCGVTVPQSLMTSSMLGLHVAYLLYNWVATGQEDMFKDQFIHREDVHEQFRYNDYLDELAKATKIRTKLENKKEK